MLTWLQDQYVLSLFLHKSGNACRLHVATTHLSEQLSSSPNYI